MVSRWALYVVSTIVTYIGISLYAQIAGGGSASAWQAFFSALRPIPLVILVVANMFFAVAIYSGFALTRYAIPMTIAAGALVSFVYSIVVLGTDVTALKVAGIVLAVAGIVLLDL